MKQATLLFLMLFIATVPTFAQTENSSPWTLLETEQQDYSLLQLQPNQFDWYQLELEALRSQLAACQIGTPGKLNQKEQTIIQIPVFGKGILPFGCWETPIMEPALQAKYPDIRTYTGYALDDPGMTVKLDVGPKGLHAMLFTAAGTILINPAITGELDQYLVFRKQDVHLHEGAGFACEVSDEPLQVDYLPKSSPTNPTGTELRTYRLALGTTGEYSTFHGGTKPLVMAAVVTTMNRVNGIYERDFTVTMVLVAETDTLFYLDPTTDPYTNNNLGNMLDENQQLCDSLIGFDNYDVGHVFGTAGGGLAGLGVVCGGVKAWGATGLGSPVGEVFDVDYTSHEFGHQFGAGHTFNDCGGAGGQPYEPGSGVTIMAYAGLCGSSNLQFTSIDQFHVASYDQVINYTQNANGNSCPLITPTGNTPPEVEVGTSGFYIPFATPFELTGSATDVDGDSLTYCWEQFDLGPSVHPDSAVGTAPLFRSWKPVNTPTRIFPRIEDLVTNTSTIGELLPQFGRELNFRMTVRDNNPAGGGVDYEQITFFAADSSGHFRVLSPNGGQLWTVGSLQTVSWDVANSDQSPVNCQEVDIYLSEDGGYTYPHLIASNRPNNGTTVITVPNVSGNQIRVKVKASNNIFFDISNNNFVILPASNPDFIVSVADPNQTICGTETIDFSIELDSLLGFQDPVNLQILDQPTGSSFSFSENDLIPPGTVQLNVSTDGTVPAGDYTVTLQASSSSSVKNIPLTIKIRDDAPPSVSLVSPFNGSVNVDRNTGFSWNAVPLVISYSIEVSGSPDFTNLIFSASGITQNFFNSEATLNPNSIYFWRVRVDSSDCGSGPWSPTFSFQTELLQCATYTSVNVPVVVSGSGTPTEYSELEIEQDILLTDVNVIDLTGAHTWVADLSITLISPSGDSTILFSDICGQNDDFFLSFDDDAPTDVIPCPPTDGLTYQPQEALAAFNGTNALGTWRLKLFDNTNQDGGALEAWSLELCGPPINTEAPTITVLGDSVIWNEALTISNTQLSGICNGSPSGAAYTLVTLPTEGSLLLNGLPLEIGATFTQLDIDSGALTYQHDGNSAEPDQFEFIMACENGVYIGGLVFEIQVLVPVSTFDLEQTTFQLYPNPARNLLVVEQAQPAGKKCVLQIADVLGRPIQQHILNGPSTQLDVQALTTGLYFCRLLEEGRLVGEQKLIIVD